MTITLNVLITLTGEDKLFSVWSEPISEIIGIEMAVGVGFTITDAVDDWYDKLPSYFFIDDENTVYKERLKYKVKRPFMVEKGASPRILRVN
jgi:hypothetical protein